MGISALLASQILDASATGRSVLTGVDASAIRTTLGLGTLATQSATITDYLTIASAASTYQPLDSDLTSIAALSTTAFGRGLLTEVSATTARSTLGLGTLATQSPTGTPSASTFLRGDFSWQTIDLSGYVPYTGATTNVDLATRSITASRFLTSSQAVPYTSVDFYAGLYVAKVVSGAGLTFEADILTIRGINGAATNALSLNGHVTLTTDTSDTLAQRRSTNPQVHRIYNTFTDASNYERAKIAWESNVLRIGTEKAGTGSARALELQTDGTTRLTIGATGNGNATFTGSVTANSAGLVSSGSGYEVALASNFASGNPGVGTVFNHQFCIYTNSTKRLQIESNGTAVTFSDAVHIAVGTTTGTKIGTATTQKLGFYNSTPVVQPTAVADATDAASVITQLNALLSRMRDLGLIAT